MGRVFASVTAAAVLMATAAAYAQNAPPPGAAPGASSTPAPAAEAIQDRYCLQGRKWGYPGNCLFSTYQQCMATASGTNAYCGINPTYAFAHQRRGRYPDRY